MKPEQLKIYNKYEYIDDSKEYIYIGYCKANKFYFFLTPKNNTPGNAQINVISELLNLDIKQVLSKLNFKHNNKYFEEYVWDTKYDINNLKVNLKNKFKNILNR